MVHIYDLDGKITENFILMRSLGWITNMIPKSYAGAMRCEELETELFYLMNRSAFYLQNSERQSQQFIFGYFIALAINSTSRIDCKLEKFGQSEMSLSICCVIISQSEMLLDKIVVE